MYESKLKQFKYYIIYNVYNNIKNMLIKQFFEVESYLFKYIIEK